MCQEQFQRISMDGDGVAENRPERFQYSFINTHKVFIARLKVIITIQQQLGSFLSGKCIN